MKILPVVFCSIHDSYGWRITWDEYSLTMGCLQYKRMTRMTYQSCTINNLKHLYILHSFTSQNNFQAKPHILCFTVSPKKTNTVRLHLHTRHESFEKVSKVSGFLGLPNHGIPVHVTSLEVRLASGLVLLVQ